MPDLKDEKDKTPLLMEDLTGQERTFLSQIVQHPGFSVIIKLFDAGCVRATQDIVKLDPEKPDYERLLTYRSQRSRNISEFSAWIRASVNYHTGVVKMQDQESEEAATDNVAKVFGIHRVPPKAKRVIGQKQESSQEAAENKSK